MQSMNFAVEVMFCFSSLAIRQLKRHLHFISDALKSIVHVRSGVHYLEYTLLLQSCKQKYGILLKN